MIPIEKQVVSLELAKQLKEAGYPQEGVWWWNNKFDSDSDIPDEFCLYSTERKNEILDWYESEKSKPEIYVAPTVAELGEALPWGYCSGKLHNTSSKKVEFLGWYCDEINVDEPQEKSDTEADARAKAWLYLKKEGLL